MHFQLEARALYRKAHTLGKKNIRKSVKEGTDPYLKELSSFLDESMVASKEELGIMEIPTENIVGVASDSAKELYASDFMPLSAPDTEFADQWCTLYLHYLSDEGIHGVITCYEYLGCFYVVDGKKRVSVVKSHGAPTIIASVTRLLPSKTEEEEIQRYYDFLQNFELTKLYQISFTQHGSFAKLQTALGYDTDHVWNEMDRFSFLFNWYAFDRAFKEAFRGTLNITTADALVVMLEDYPYSKLRQMYPWVLTSIIQSAWKKLYKVANPNFVFALDQEVKKVS